MTRLPRAMSSPEHVCVAPRAQCAAPSRPETTQQAERKRQRARPAVASNAANDAPRARVQRPTRAMMIPEHGCMSLKRYKGLDSDWLNRRPEPGFRLRKAAQAVLFSNICMHKATLCV